MTDFFYCSILKYVLHIIYSMTLKNGDKAITSCFFCDSVFEEKQAFGTEIHCDPESGGCGMTFNFQIRSKAKQIEDE